jgi:hypothetical protein
MIAIRGADDCGSLQLTGRNHHEVATGTITELSTGFPGYNSI